MLYIAKWIYVWCVCLFQWISSVLHAKWMLIFDSFKNPEKKNRICLGLLFLLCGTECVHTRKINNECVSHIYMCIIVCDRKSAVEIERERMSETKTLAHWRWISNRCCRTHTYFFGQFSICFAADAAPQTNAFNFTPPPPLCSLYRYHCWLVNRARLVFALFSSLLLFLLSLIFGLNAKVLGELKIVRIASSIFHEKAFSSRKILEQTKLLLLKRSKKDCILAKLICFCC